MIFCKTGEVRDGLFVIGSAHNPVYLLNCEEPFLIEGGLSLLGELYRKDIFNSLGKLEPKTIFLTHVHFDHCGAVAYLKKAFPSLKVAASSKSLEILRRPNAVRLMKILSRNAWESVKGIDEKLLLPDAFEAFNVDVILQDGDIVRFNGGLSVQVLHTAGHTRDSMSYYIAEKKILIASESAGCAVNPSFISIDCLTDFGAYLTSLKRLASLDVDILCQGHRYVYTDESVKVFFEQSMRSALYFKELVQEFWHEEKQVLDKVMSRIKKLEYDSLPPPKQPEQAYLANLEARIRSVLKYSSFL